MDKAEMDAIAALREDLKSVRSEIAEVREVQDWLFVIAPGDTESRADIIMKTCRRVAKLDTQIRAGVRVLTGIVAFLGAWKAGLGEWLSKFFSLK